MQDFLRAVESQDIPVTDDLQDLVTGHGAEHWLKWINRDTGRRSDSAHAYIHSTRAKQGNLHLVCNTKVEKCAFPYALLLEFYAENAVQSHSGRRSCCRHQGRPDQAAAPQ